MPATSSTGLVYQTEKNLAEHGAEVDAATKSELEERDRRRPRRRSSSDDAEKIRRPERARAERPQARRGDVREGASSRARPRRTRGAAAGGAVGATAAKATRRRGRRRLRRGQGVSAALAARGRCRTQSSASNRDARDERVAARRDATTTRCSGSAATAERRRHQEGLPQAGAQVSPRPQPRRQGSAERVQGGDRGLPGPLRRREARASTIASARRPSTVARAVRRLRFRSFAGFEDIFGDLFGDFFGTGRRRGGAVARAAATTCATTSRSDLRGGGVRLREDASRFRARSACERLRRSAAPSAGTAPKTCPAVAAPARCVSSRASSASPRPAASATGRARVIARSVPDLPGQRRRARSSADAQRAHPGRRRQRLAPEAARRGRGRASAAARPATSTSCCRCASTRSSSARAATSSARSRISFAAGRARRRDRGADARRQGMKMQIPPGTQSGASSASKGKGVADLRGYGRGDHAGARRRRDPAQAHQAAEEAARGVRQEARATIAAGSSTKSKKCSAVRSRKGPSAALLSFGSRVADNALAALLGEFAPCI